MGISVIIPVYNCEQWLEESIASALQFDMVKEVIVVDDGSSDNSPKLISKLVESDPRIVRLSHQNNENKGRSASRNLGTQVATQPWVAFLDADDYFLPNRFDGIDWDTEIDGYYGTIVSKNLVNTDQSGVLTGVPKSVKPEELFEYLTEQSEHYFSIISMTIRRDKLLSTTLFDEQLAIGEDTDLIWRLSHELSLDQGNMSDPIAVRRVHASNHDPEDPGRAEFYRKWLIAAPHELSDRAQKRMFYSYQRYKGQSYSESRLYEMYRFYKWKLSGKGPV